MIVVIAEAGAACWAPRPLREDSFITLARLEGKRSSVEVLNRRQKLAPRLFAPFSGT